MCNAFSSPKCLAQNIYNMHIIFCQFSDIKSVGQFQQPSILSQLVTGEPQHIAISCPREN